MRFTLEVNNPQYWLVKADELIRESTSLPKEKFHDNLRLAITLLAMVRVHEENSLDKET